MRPTHQIATHHQHFANFGDGCAVLMRALGYQFDDLALLRRALTHRSCINAKSYERLEFLGDALLGAIVANFLYHKYDDLDEGRLTRARATLVREETLAIVGKKLGLPNHIILGAGERKGGGRHRASIIADCVEAIIAAIFLDAKATQKHIDLDAIVLQWYGDLLNLPQTPQKDAKTRLQELLQRNKKPLPEYILTKTVGQSPDEVFFVRCFVPIEHVNNVDETGASKRQAEHKCAESMIIQLHRLGMT